MSITTGPKIITDGLSFGYDMKDPQSYLGPVATNQFAIPTVGANNNVTFAVQGTGTFQRVYSGTYGGYTITNNDVVYRYDLGLVGCHYHGNAVTIPAGVYPIFSFDYYISPDAANFPTADFLANFENYAGGAKSASATLPNTNKGVWQTVTFSGGLTTTSGTQAMFLYPGACGNSYLASSGYILYKNPQVLFSATPNFTAPFTGPFGARSSTQALRDITGTNTITVDSLTYNTNGTEFSFDGTNRVTTTISGSASQTKYTRIVWVKPTLLNTGDVKSVMLNSVGNNSDMAIGIANYSYAAFHQYTNSNGPGTNVDYTATGSTIMSVNNTYMIAVTVDTTTSTNNIKIYLNGALDGTASRSLGTAASDTVIIGGPAVDGYGGTRMFYGTCYAAQHYNRILSADEIAQNFSASRGRYGI